MPFPCYRSLVGARATTADPSMTWLASSTSRWPEALARMRAQAHASGQQLAELAGQIIDGSAVVVRDLHSN